MPLKRSHNFELIDVNSYYDFKACTLRIKIEEYTKDLEIQVARLWTCGSLVTDLLKFVELLAS